MAEHLRWGSIPSDKMVAAEMFSPAKCQAARHLGDGFYVPCMGAREHGSDFCVGHQRPNPEQNGVLIQLRYWIKQCGINSVSELIDFARDLEFGEENEVDLVILTLRHFIVKGDEVELAKLLPKVRKRSELSEDHKTKLRQRILINLIKPLGELRLSPDQFSTMISPLKCFVKNLCNDWRDKQDSEGKTAKEAT